MYTLIKKQTADVKLSEDGSTMTVKYDLLIENNGVQKWYTDMDAVSSNTKSDSWNNLLSDLGATAATAYVAAKNA